ncbi:MAG: aspartate carbamoyltransferase catalytic subunit [Elusimicrobia bacterium]|nr:aspartate carbamoyltransferase catalytic subunit [Elusimicrobiota bacterium]
MAHTIWNRKDLLGLEGLSRPEVEAILDAAASFKTSSPEPVLQSRILAFLFSEPSTRTRSAFEAAALRLGAKPLGFSATASSLAKGETLLDTVKNLEALGVAYIVARQEASGALEPVASKTNVSILNAGDGLHEHPTQALLDLFTLREKKGRLDGLKVVFVGDALHSRVARSNLVGLKAMGARVTFCGPRSLAPDAFARLGAKIERDMDAAIKGADAIYCLRLQLERQKDHFFASLADYRAAYGLTGRRLALAPEAVVMHGGPLNRGVEIDDEPADGPQSAILSMVENGVYVRMAAFSLIEEWRRRHGLG